MDARNCFFGFQIVSGVSNKPFPTYFGAVMTAEHVFENVLKCFKITIFKLENRISMINSRSEAFVHFWIFMYKATHIHV